MEMTQELKQKVIDLIGKENIQKSRISVDKKGLWIWHKHIKTMPYFIDVLDTEYLFKDKDYREAILIEFSNSSRLL